MFFLSKFFKHRDHYGKTVRSSYLANRGWYLSLERHKALTADTHSAALLPYSLADILTSRIQHSMTAYVRWDMHTYRWMLHLAHHVSSDHITMHRMGDSKRGHFERINEPDKVHINDYIQSHAERFNVMIMDGPAKRTECEEIIKMLAGDGVVVMVDDMLDPYDCDTVAKFMNDKGFKSLDFVNPAPLYHELGAKLFYREGNCLNI